MTNNLMIGDVVYMNYCLEADCKENQHAWKINDVDGDWVFLDGYGGCFKAEFLYREKPIFFTPFLPYRLTYMRYDRWLGWQKEYVQGWSIDEVVKKLNADTENLKRSEKKEVSERELIMVHINTDTEKWELSATIKLDWRKNVFCIKQRWR